MSEVKGWKNPISLASHLSGGTSLTTVGEWSARTLRRQSKAFTDAILKDAGGCDVNAITLTREVLRKLDAEEEGYPKETMVNSAIVLALKIIQAPGFPRIRIQ